MLILFWAVFINVALKCIHAKTFCGRERPENNHGVHPLVLIGDQEQLLQAGTKLAELPNLSPEWSLSFAVRLHADTTSTGYCNLVQLTKQNHASGYGDRTPLISVKTPSRRIHITSSINTEWNHAWENLILNIDQTYQMEVHQRYVSNGHYRYFIMIDGVKVYSVLNTDARQFYNVKVYASNPFIDACPAYIKNLKVTNFL
ncbi:uncharacterized protein [Clytia hemisphaerica]|uniref:Uncharacterized protein n=1 Tax=Clytia hemisphaerica TaxID=252671 RepID=A0A7M5XHV7_9CNID